ncbi:glycoside hydrolase family 16 protein [Polychaeton citri CBS 116435]|uniref:Glycoside hydrolase family 16 protein n=1 Tax=Polychaeton citri CBS 116435 TaxID=1314669 RepID=A0A9P4UR26_9PEZI|nr:glycoside hydrolase family 16 protein [Polychaeton citri CBS 116435]
MPRSFLKSITVLATSLSFIPSALAAPAAGGYTLATDLSGPSFFEGFYEYTGEDPTNGLVAYQELRAMTTAKFTGLSSRGNPVVGVDDVNAAPNGRHAMRLTSKVTVQPGSLSIFDIHHMPVGCGTWPALWYLGSGQNWPAAGEFDIIEVVNSFPGSPTGYFSAQTMHTSPGCSVQNSTAFQGVLQHSDCNTDNAGLGCSIQASNNYTTGSTTFATAGAGFNANDGGVYVYEWLDSGMTVWMFPRSAIPSDIVAGKPNPQSWTQKPLAKFAGSDCDYTKAFQDMQLIINTDFCGSWAGKPEVWKSSGCAAKTETATCNDYVANNPTAFSSAFWEIASVKIYTSGSAKLGQGPDPNTPTKKRDMEVPRSARMAARGVSDDHSGCADETHLPVSWQRALNATYGGNSTNETIVSESQRRSTSLDLTERAALRTPIVRRSVAPDSGFVEKNTRSETSDASTREVVGWATLAAIGFVIAAIV